MIITLTTDFGTRDTYIAQMKGVILGIAPAMTIVDVTHNIPPRDVLAGALALDAAIDAFPDRTIHIGVVDPGVGTSRAAIAVDTRHFVLVGPDNGLFAEVLDRHAMTRAVRLTNTAYHRQPVAATFHGRDIFAPVAAHIANGTSLDDLGKSIRDVTDLDRPHPEQIEGGLRLHVVGIDTFGNLITDLRPNQIDHSDVIIQIGQTRIAGICQTFGSVPQGAPLAYFGSSDHLEIAVRDGDAATQLGVQQGHTLELKFAK